MIARSSSLIAGAMVIQPCRIVTAGNRLCRYSVQLAPDHDSTTTLPLATTATDPDQGKTARRQYQSNPDWDRGGPV
jgi:hypothetical protein